MNINNDNNNNNWPGNWQIGHANHWRTLENLPFCFSSCQYPTKGEMQSLSSTPLTPIRCRCNHILRSTMFKACGFVQKNIFKTLMQTLETI